MRPRSGSRALAAGGCSKSTRSTAPKSWNIGVPLKSPLGDIGPNKGQYFASWNMDEGVVMPGFLLARVWDWRKVMLQLCGSYCRSPVTNLGPI